MAMMFMIKIKYIMIYNFKNLIHFYNKKNTLDIMI